MIAFGDTLSNLLHDPLQFLHGCDYPRLDKFQFWRDSIAKFAPDSGKSIDVLDGVPRLGELADDVVFSNNRVEYLSKML